MRVLQRFPDESEKTYYAVLSVGYGLLADIDIESERLRSLGESRFTIWAVLRLIGLKTYRMKVSYLQAEPGDKGETQPQRLSPRLFRSTTEVEKPRNDELMRRTISADTNIISDPLEPFADNQIEYGDLAEDFVAADTFGPSSKYSPLTGEIPSDWVTIEGDFVLVYAVLQRFIGTDNMFAPKSKMDDGLIYLLLIRGDASRGQLFQFLTSFESGTHVDVPCCEMIPVKAFRLEPQTSEGNLTIDGEKVPTAPVQVEILPSFYRVFMR
ncbi:hypothetical protein QYM36_012244 [Artemia franciscana]|uniref:YegS/DAGK C-terminal domain-containing protein n=2 Tax=Artemia franciscana TaxID=6661 RepID=A0AA88HNQ2_ARTSF|nr:hypothetical protein QYM36_012244 [Artemia franciscana]